MPRNQDHRRKKMLLFDAASSQRGGWRNQWTTPLRCHWRPNHRHRAMRARHSTLAFKICFACCIA